ncbi:LysR family transcriptional regulator [Brevibacillus fortis]|uniref:LysR family transcriptional regulator n=1 Tax=Brevibacillus fortis TaxID=2126352 RepID=A0A2P7VJ55_9BACL|nr:LysR family transcriptional regulator [Brevibacillus fortis]PSJ99241.1 LysR family transcriptional regulator [Brevibacillus fortis]
MNLEQLEYIVEVAKEGSLTKAAQNKHVTLSAISQSLSNLEAELGVTLFSRSHLGAVPTPEGKIIIKKAFEALGKIQEIWEEAQKYTNTLSGELRLATIPGPLTVLINAASNFKKDYPHIRTHITEKGTQEILEDILQDKLDFGLVIIHQHLLKKSEGLSLVFEPLFEVKTVVGVTKNSPLASQSSITPDELCRHPFILYNDTYVKTFVDEFVQAYGPVDILFTSNITDVITNALRQNLAVTIGLDYSFMRDPEIIMLEMDIPYQQPVYLGLVRSAERHNSHISMNFINRLQYDLKNK